MNNFKPSSNENPIYGRWSTLEFGLIWPRAVADAWKSPELKARLIADPNLFFLEQYGWPSPEGVKYKVLGDFIESKAHAQSLNVLGTFTELSAIKQLALKHVCTNNTTSPDKRINEVFNKIYCDPKFLYVFSVYLLGQSIFYFAKFAKNVPSIQALAAAVKNSVDLEALSLLSKQFILDELDQFKSLRNDYFKYANEYFVEIGMTKLEFFPSFLHHKKEKVYHLFLAKIYYYLSKEVPKELSTNYLTFIFENYPLQDSNNKEFPYLLDPSLNKEQKKTIILTNEVDQKFFSTIVHVFNLYLFFGGLKNIDNEKICEQINILYQFSENEVSYIKEEIVVSDNEIIEEFVEQEIEKRSEIEFDLLDKLGNLLIKLFETDKEKILTSGPNKNPLLAEFAKLKTSYFKLYKQQFYNSAFQSLEKYNSTLNTFFQDYTNVYRLNLATLITILNYSPPGIVKQILRGIVQGKENEIGHIQEMLYNNEDEYIQALERISFGPIIKKLLKGENEKINCKNCKIVHGKLFIKKILALSKVNPDTMSYIPLENAEDYMGSVANYNGWSGLIQYLAAEVIMVLPPPPTEKYQAEALAQYNQTGSSVPFTFTC